jgi:hypothetical protein
VDLCRPGSLVDSAQVSPDDLFGLSAQVLVGTDPYASEAQPVSRRDLVGSHQAQSMPAKLIGLFWLKPLDQGVELGVVVITDAHSDKITLDTQRVACLLHDAVPHDPQAGCTAAQYSNRPGQ